MKELMKAPIIINALLFQCAWFACVLGSAKGLTWPSMVCFLALATYQLQNKRRHPTDIKLLIISLVLGLFVDSFWIIGGFMVFTENGPIAQIAPAWILFLWMSFALTINHSLGWLKKHPLLPISMGLFGGPMSYIAGLKFGAVEYLQSTLVTSVALGIAWALSLIILVKASQINDTQNVASA